MGYDSTVDTQKHISDVQRNLLEIVILIGGRAKFHDASKLVAPEKEIMMSLHLGSGR